MHGYTDELAQAFGESIIALIERVQLYMEYIFLFIHIYVLFYFMWWATTHLLEQVQDLLYHVRIRAKEGLEMQGKPAKTS